MRRIITLTAEPGIATQRLQAALDRAKDGPVHVILAAGEHLSGGLRLHSGTTLEITEGATLRFLPDYDAYAQTTVAVEAEQSNRAMLTATAAEDITLCGKGRILCDGAERFSRGDDAVMGTRIPMAERPRVLVFDRCTGVSLRDLTVLDSPMWTLHFVACDGLDIEGLTILNDLRMPNTDGIVIDSCQGVSIRNCEIRTADDGIVLKTSKRLDGATPAPCSGITVEDCTLESRSCALKIGTESHADFEDINFRRCRIEASNRALGIFSRDGGAVRRVTFEDFDLTCEETPDGFWGSGEPVTITALDRREERPAGEVSEVLLKDIRGAAPGAVCLWAERAGLVRAVRLANVSLRQNPGLLGTSDRFDLRPTPADLVPSEDAAGRVNAWRLGADGRVIGLHDYPGGKPGLFAHNVVGLSVEGFDVDRPEPLPGGWNRESVVTSSQL